MMIILIFIIQNSHNYWNVSILWSSYSKYLFYLNFKIWIFGLEITILHHHLYLESFSCKFLNFKVLPNPLRLRSQIEPSRSKKNSFLNGLSTNLRSNEFYMNYKGQFLANSGGHKFFEFLQILKVKMKPPKWQKIDLLNQKNQIKKRLKL